MNAAVQNPLWWRLELNCCCTSCACSQRHHTYTWTPGRVGMAVVTWMLRVLYAAALHLSLPSLASGLFQGAVVGQNVSLPCNLTTCREVTWFVVRDNTVLLLLTARKSKITGGNSVERHSLGTDRARLVEGLELHQLLLLRVEEADSGLYFCSGVRGGAHRIGPGVSLLVGGGQPDIQSDIQPCWSVTLCLLPSSIVLLLSTCMWLYLCAAKPTRCQHRCGSFGKGVSEEASLQYSSLKLRPLGLPAKRLARNQVIYASVKPPGQSAPAGEIP